MWKDRRSVSQRDEREDKRRGVIITLAVSCTGQIDTQIERESWRDVELLLTIATGMKRTTTAKMVIIVWQISYPDIDLNNRYPDIG